MMNEYGRAFGEWLGQPKVGAVICGLLCICLAGLALAEVFTTRGYTRHQKNVGILAFLVACVVVAGALVGMFLK